jgi:hypothetical protein
MDRVHRFFALTILAVVTACGGASTTPHEPPHATGSVLFKKVPRRTGEVFEVSFENETSLHEDVAYDGPPQHQDVTESAKLGIRVEVVSVVGARTTEAKITFTSLEQWRTEGGTRARKTSPLEGKSYVLHADAERTMVLDAQRAPVGEELASEIREAFDLERFDEAHLALPETPIAPRTDVAALADAFSHGPDGKGVRVTFERAEGDDGVFSVRSKHELERDGSRTTISSESEYHVQISTSEITRMHMTGAMVIHSLPAARPRIDGTGELRATFRARKLPAHP